MQERDWLSAILAFILTAPDLFPLADWPSVVQITEVTPAKRVVWALPDWKTLGPASAIQLLDEPGVPEKGDLQR
jgi:hypothetical protein